MTATPRDTPRLAYRELEGRATLATSGILLVLSGLAWWSTVRRSDGMAGMVQGLSSVGTPMMGFDMSVPVFMLMWTTMMVAMMFPTIAPIVLLHRAVLRRRNASVGTTIGFGAGYLVVWTVAGLIPLSVLIAFRHASSNSGWVAPASGLVLVVAGGYQFTRWKQICQRACQSPMTFLMTHDFGTGVPGAVRTGGMHGLFCLGCCWALMAVLFVVGLMNLAWMAAISVVFLVEKNVRRGDLVSAVVGIALICVGTAILFHPATLTSVTA